MPDPPDGAKADRTCLGSEATETIETDRVALKPDTALRASPGDVMLNWRGPAERRVPCMLMSAEAGAQPQKKATAPKTERWHGNTGYKEERS